MDLKTPRWGDIAIAAALLVLGLIGVSQTVDIGVSRGHPYDAIGVALVVAQVVPLAWRQHYPRLVLWAVLVPWLIAVGFGYPDTAAMFAIYVALYGVAAYVARREALLHGAAVLAVMIAWTTVGVLVTDFVPWTALVAVTLAVIVPMMVGFVDFRRRERLTELEVAHARREQAQRTVAADAVRAERARIARELHDVVAHEITVMTLQAEGARRLAKDSDERVVQALGTISESGRTGLAEMQRMIGVLRASEQEAAEAAEHDRVVAGVPLSDADLAPMPSLAAIPQLAQQVEDAGLPVDLTISGTSHVPAGVELSAYRIVQEALTNAMKHAGPGARATVAVERRRRLVRITVDDDGRGAISDAARLSGGHGLRGMRERVQALGGALEYGPRRGGGFRVMAELPSGDDQVAVPRAKEETR
ncbi:sensor histidine kinase [Demequina sp. SYSU T00039]|uniref:histidine kinase n=1 Tax=Demequina lignilytica TaxID=3051663 RepID=A0AAW7M9L7_9MICO|nr:MULTISPECIES: sensor histidine kinase [unclassified Demequina]MDN4478079.1 sensor histidine kinase [Demequina sp. SYSU T00039-1]MDN4488471.1 sensor histidine kinase [Demequina sp. SYSU T00039]MDN4489982.1 sensor histidine kinase [Demequina sp. SYSU T00068]